MRRRSADFCKKNNFTSRGKYVTINLVEIGKTVLENNTASVAQWIEQWFPVPCAGVRFPSDVLTGTSDVPACCINKEDKNLDDFREWLSDNLRYFMLGGAILIIVAVLFFGIRACVGNKKGKTDADKNVEAQNDQGNVPSSSTKDGETDDGKKGANPMEKASAEVTALMKSYYKALGDKDIAALKAIEVDLPPVDEAKVTNAKDYIEGYEVGDVYTKKGMEDGTYVVYVCFNYICKDIDTPVPALSQCYVITDSEGNLKIDGGAVEDTEISAYTDKLKSDDDVKELTAKVQKANDDAQANDPALAAFLAGLGEETNASTQAGEGTTLTVTEDCNVRAAADGEAEIIGGYSAGTEVTKTGEEGEWIQIDYEGETGYIHNSLLE